MIRTKSLVAAAVVVGLGLVGCGKQPDVVGKWDLIARGGPTGTTMQFDPDGTVTLSVPSQSGPKGGTGVTKGHYAVTGNTMTITTAVLPTGGAGAVAQAILVRHWLKTHAGQMPPPAPKDHEVDMSLRNDMLVLDPHYGANQINLQREK